MVKDGKIIPNARVYVFAITPNGTRFITRILTGPKGVGGATLSIRDIIKPIDDWNKMEKRSFILYPGLYITAVGEDGEYEYFGASSVKLPLTLTGPLSVQKKVQLKDKLRVSKKMYSAQESGRSISVEQQAPPWAQLIWSEEHTRRETVLQVTTDAHSMASVAYLIEKNKEVAFKCTYSITSEIDDEVIVEWSIGAEISWVISSTEKYLTMDVVPNSVGYVSFMAAVNYECWRYEEPADSGQYFLEHRVYIMYYWPDTLDKIKGDDEITGKQELLKSKSGQGWDQSVYTVYFHYATSYSFAIPVGTIVKLLASPYLPAALEVPIDVELVLKDTTAINADARIFAEEGYIVDIYLIEVWRTLNAYYHIPAWALILTTRTG